MSIRCFMDRKGTARTAIEGYVIDRQVVEDLLRDKSLMICEGIFKEAYLLDERVKQLVEKLLEVGKVPYSAGLYIGRLRRKRPTFIPSVNLLNKLHLILKRPYRALVVKKEGIKPFLYGKDILKASVVGCYAPIIKGDVIAVFGEDKQVYGIGLSTISSCNEIKDLKRTDPVAIHVFDVGWYLRGGTEPRERMYTLLK